MQSANLNERNDIVKRSGPKFKWNILSFISKLNAWTLLMYYCTVMCWWFSCDWERSGILPALTFANVNVGKHWSHNILYDTSKVCHLVFRLICCWGGVHVVSWKGQMGQLKDCLAAGERDAEGKIIIMSIF